MFMISRQQFCIAWASITNDRHSVFRVAISG